MIKFCKEKAKIFLQFLNDRNNEKNAFERALDETFIGFMVVLVPLDIFIFLICFLFDL